MNRTLFLTIFLLVPSIAICGDLRVFTTDGCSVFPDGNFKEKSLWANCCIRHDLAYWKGGTADERIQADRDLKNCVSKVGKPKIAALMLAGVRVGGSPYYPTSYRWGYGWPYMRGYKELSEEDKQEVKAKLDQVRVLIDSLYEELK